MEEEWAPLTLTLVEYPAGDALGKALALASLTPFAILAGFVALILFRRDLHTIAFFCGTLANEALNALLKAAIAEERPMRRAHSYAEYGMPSSHAQFMWFFAAYTAYFACIRLRTARSHAWAWALTACVCAAAAVVCCARVYLMYHSVRQVFVGALVGLCAATAWFALTHCVLTPLFPHVVAWKVSELLLLRDTTTIPNVLWFEYTNSRQEARARARKLVPMKAQ